MTLQVDQRSQSMQALADIAGSAIASQLPLEYPLSDAQRALWYLDRLHGPTSTYNVPHAVRLNGSIDRSALQRSVQALVQRHACLRSSFSERNGIAHQTVSASVTVTVEHVTIDPAAAEQQTERSLVLAMTQAANQPFDLRIAPLLRVRLYRLGPQLHVLQYVTHHIVTDGWSMAIFALDLATFYSHFYAADAALAQPAPPAQLSSDFPDYLKWHQQQDSEPATAVGLAWWQQHLSGLAPLGLPSDRYRSASANDQGDRVHVRLDAALTEQLRLAARRHRVTLFALLLTTFKVLIHRIGGSNDFAVGVPTAGREQQSFEDMIGLFVNMLALRTKPQAQLAFSDYLQQVWHTLLDAFNHRQVPFERIVAQLKPTRVINQNPLFQVSFALQNTPTRPMQLPGLAVEQMPDNASGSHFDLTLSLTEVDDQLHGYFEFRRDLFDRETVRHLVQQYCQIARVVVQDPHTRIGDIALMDETERERVLSLGRGAHWRAESSSTDTTDQSNVPSSGPASCPDINELFEQQVQKNPSALAVSDTHHEYTYAQLGARANQIAHWLREQLTYSTQAPRVAIAMPRSVAWVAACLGVVKAGMAYVPVDPSTPPLRMHAILEDCGAALLLAARCDVQSYEQSLRGTATRCVALEDIVAQPGSAQTDPAPAFDRQRLAYVMYTSGSTGVAKGVCISVASVVALVTNTDYIQFTCRDRVAQVSNVAFDAATFEVWGALLNGAHLMVIEKDTLLSGATLARTIKELKLSILFLTTSLFNAHAHSNPSIFQPLSTLMFGGEACDLTAVARVLAAAPPRRLVNGYGPTETTTFAAWHEFAADDLAQVTYQTVRNRGHCCPIGRPLASARCHVLQSNGQLAPVGSVGEIHIGGSGLAQGYLNDPVLTSARFIADPFVPGQRLYRSGDLGRLRADGVIDYLGRKDRQIKLRGYRIELAEVEQALMSLPGVQQAAVLLQHKQGADEGAEYALAAFVVAGSGQALSADWLRRQLAAVLPAHAVPATVSLLERFPVTANGKLDEQCLLNAQLPPPAHNECSDDSSLAPLQLQLVAIWRAVLSQTSIGLDDHFVDVGGHSLLGLRLIAAIERDLGVTLNPSTLVTAPTVRAQAELLSAQADLPQSHNRTRLVVPVRVDGARPPLFFIRSYGDLSFDYRALLAQLSSEQPFYLLDLAALGELVHRSSSLQQLALALVPALRGAVPNGPVHLCGHSLAGNLAWELACAIHPQGEPSGQVILLDCYAPGYPLMPPRAVRWLIKTAQALQRGPAQVVALYRARWQRGFRDLLPLLPRYFDQIRMTGGGVVSDVGDVGDVGDTRVSRDVVREWERGWISISRLWQRHQPTRYWGPVHLLRASVRSPEAGVRDNDPQCGWSQFASRPLQVLPISCDHVQIIHPAHGAQLGALLEQCLQSGAAT
jgi:amino acid adenylation domain-containing protein